MVRTVTTSPAATSLLVRPSATSSATRRSTGVSVPARRRGRRSAKLGARSLDPDGCAELLEDRERLPETPGLRASSPRAAAQSRAREASARSSGMATRSCWSSAWKETTRSRSGLLRRDQAVTASGGRPGGRSIERRTTVLVPREHGLRLLEPSEGHECLDVVGNAARRAPERRCTRPGNEWPEVRAGLHGLLEGDWRGIPPRRRALHERCVRADGDLERSLAGFAAALARPRWASIRARLARINAVFAGCPA